MKFLRSITVIIIPALMLSCQKNKGAIDTNIEAKTILGASYGPEPSQNMDVYLPAGRSVTSAKILLMIHGGAWESGDKADMRAYIDTIKNRLPGYAIFNINYRLSVNSSSVFPTQENDIKKAFDFIINKSAEYNLSQKVVLMGVSAGGHLALLQGYKYVSPVKAAAIVSFFGPTDMTDMYNNPASPLVPASYIAAVVGTTPSEDSLLYATSSPVNFVSSASPPTILLHGGLDPLVRPQQAVSLQLKLRDSGVINQYVFYPAEGHGFTNATVADSFDKIQEFLSSNVH